MTLGYLVYWFGALADWYTTKRGMDGGGTELNPVMGYLMRTVGRDWGISILKLGVFLFFLWYGMPQDVFVYAGVIQVLAAAGNHFGWWTVIRNRLGG
jgi:hypothetical protein